MSAFLPPKPRLLPVSRHAQELRGGARSLSNAKLLELPALAAQSIGIKDVARLRGLVLEQSQLIKELRLLREHVEQLDSEIVNIVAHAREGQILLSFPGFGAITAATIIAAIGSIHNFPSASALKSYFGWAPVVVQSGSTLDHSRLTRGGTRTMKQILFLAVLQAIRLQDNEWAKLYERLVKTRCPYDEKTQSRVGKKRVIGRVAGQMTEAIYALLKRDAELLAKILPGQDPPAPLLYDPEVHQRHRQGYYRPLKSTPLPNTITGFILYPPNDVICLRVFLLSINSFSPFYTPYKLDFVHFLTGSVEFFLVGEAQMSFEIPLRKVFFNITAFQ